MVSVRKFGGSSLAVSFYMLVGLPIAMAVPPDMIRATEKRLDREAGLMRSFLPATGGSATSAYVAGFDSSGITVLAQVPVSAFSLGSNRANDLWGYVSPSGREYCILGLDHSTGFIEVTNPTSPVIVAEFADGTGLTSDIGVYQHYAYNVADSGPGMQIFDLEQIDDGIVTLLGTAGGNLNGAHNLYLNPDSGFVYLCASNLTAGFVAYDLANPAVPVLAGSWTDTLAHDLLALSYDDCPYAGRSGPCEIAFVFAGGAGLYTVDVSDKENMVTLAQRTYPNLSYCHQGWATDDRKYLFIDDELDELFGGVPTTTTYIFDIQDVSDPQFVTSYTNGKTSTDHNLMLRGNLVFSANYTTGLRVFDASDIFNVTEIAYLDTHPSNDAPGFNGAWTVYPLLPSENILLSDIEDGLFIVKLGEPPCDVVTAPAAEIPLVAQNRYLTITPTNEGVLTAIRLIPSGLPEAFADYEGMELWLTDPFEVSEVPANADTTDPTFTVTSLSCEPSFRDWGSIGTVYATGDVVVPGVSFTVQAISQGCLNAGKLIYSSSVFAATSVFGDVTGDCSGKICSPPNGAVEILDIFALIGKFVNAPGSVQKSRADLQPGCVDFVIDILDVFRAVEGFNGLPYPFEPNISGDPCASLAACPVPGR